VKPTGVLAPDRAAPRGLGLLRQAGRGEAKVLISGMGLIAGRVASMGLGFIAWLVAARVFPPSEVGVASGLVAAMMLCVQIALFGIGSAAIAAYADHHGSPSRLLNTGATAVVVTSAVIGLVFIGLAAVAFDELRVVVVPAYAVAFMAMAVFGTLNTFYDHASIALHRGDQVLVRNAAFGLVSILGVLVLPRLVEVSGSLVIVASWAAAGLVACLLALVQLRRSVPSFRPQAAIDVPLAGALVRTGVPNWLLTLTERAPALILPILVTELLSPTTNAFWYAVWMMGWVVLIVPISIGQTLFAEASQRPRAIASAVRRAVRSSLAIGVAAAIVLAILAEVALGLLGEAYAAAGVLSLRVLVLSVVPYTLTQSYYAVCRARGALGEAIVVGMIIGVAALGITLVGGSLGGLVGMAVGWLAVHVLAGLWAALRIRTLIAAQPIEATAEV
jgi:O-antigen/teichoic acid export membrane protein